MIIILAGLLAVYGLIGCIFYLINAKPQLYFVLFVLLFLISIFLGQKYLYGGTLNLHASAIMGACFSFSFCFLCYLCNLIYYSVAGMYHPAFWGYCGFFDPLDPLLFGAVAGYIMGIPIYGIRFICNDSINPS